MQFEWNSYRSYFFLLLLSASTAMCLRCGEPEVMAALRKKNSALGWGAAVHVIGLEKAMSFLWKRNGLCLNAVEHFLYRPNKWGWISVQEEVFIVCSWTFFTSLELMQLLWASSTLHACSNECWCIASCNVHRSSAVTAANVLQETLAPWN